MASQWPCCLMRGCTSRTARAIRSTGVRVGSASEGDVLMVLRNMEHVIKNHLSKGDVVKLSSLGTFSPTIRAKAVDKADDVNQFSITSTGINFKPTQRLLNGVREAGVWLADKRIMKSIVRKKGNNE